MLVSYPIKKPRMILVDTELNYCNEAIMNQNPSHSQMPEFAKNESNTKPVLFQHPTLAEMRPSRRAQFIADLKDLALFIVFAIFAWLLITVLLNAFFGG